MNAVLDYLRHNKICIALYRLFRLDDIKAYRIKRKHYVFKFKEMKPKLYLPYYQKDYIQQRIFLSHNYFEYDNLNFICKKWNDGIIGKFIQGKTILDIGTNIGNHTLYFFFECNIKESYNFEPIDDTINIFKKNIEINNLSSKVHVYNAAIGCEKGQANIFSYNETNIGATQLVTDANGKIPVITVDSLNIHDCIGLIKIDVEGFEIDVLKGMHKTLSQQQPYILIEVKDSYFDDVFHILSSFGYSFVKLDKFETYADYLFYK